MGGKNSKLQTKIIYVLIFLALGLVIGLTLAIREINKEEAEPTAIKKEEEL